MNRSHVVLAASLLWIASTNALSAEVSTANLTLDPTYDVAGCALVTPNGYGGTDRQIFVPNVDGYYTVKDYSSNNTDALITVEAFDPNTELVEQALAGTDEYRPGCPRIPISPLAPGSTYGRFTTAATGRSMIAKLMVRPRR